MISETRQRLAVFGLAFVLAGSLWCAAAEKAQAQALDFGVYWPPLDNTSTNLAGRRPLLKGLVEAVAEPVADGVSVRLQVTFARPADEASRAYWNSCLAYAEYDWMARLRVWDADHLWLWPNLAYLLRIHGTEREERYGGVDIGKGVDNDFAAVLIRVPSAAEPLVAAEWYPVGVEDPYKWTVSHTARSDAFTFTLGGAEPRQGAAVWLIYADFMGAKPPQAWPQELEYAGGILGYFEIERVEGSAGVCLRQRVPPSGTRFDWAGWAKKTREASDSASTARLSDRTQ